MRYQLNPLQTASLGHTKVLLRLDLDVPLENGVIMDATRLKDSLSTVHYLLDRNVSIIIVGHLGRPKGFNSSLTLEPIVEWFRKEFGITQVPQKNTLGSFQSFQLNQRFTILENIRFFEGEEKNDPMLSQQLASLADIYVDDAFAVSHRNHASIVGVARLLPHFAGLHLQKEVETLSKVIEDPKRPLVVIIGGAKIETKLPMVEKMHQVADYVLVGGKIAQETRTLLQVQHEKVSNRISVLLISDLNSQKTDVTEKSIENFLQIINIGQTIIWNGPVGMTENPQERSDLGTKKLAFGIVQTKAFTVLGGGDTIEFVQKLGLLDKFSFVSSGGGAMLAFLSGEDLPGLRALS